MQNKRNRNRIVADSRNEKKGKLKCFLINARSIINKKEELEAKVYEQNPDLVLIDESWAKDKHSTGELNLKGYDCHRNDRKSTDRGGGCIIYAKTELKTVMIENLTKTENTDTVWCRYEDIKIGVCYNTTANNVEQEEPLLELIKRACESNGETIITGDFNHETIDWDLMEANTEGQRFLDTTEDLFLTQHVKQATREGNILDLVLSTNPDQIRNVAVTEKLGNSDHNIVEFEIVTEERPASWKTKYRDYRKADYEKIREEIQSEEYTQDTEGDTMYLWNKLKDKLKDIVERNIPLKERKNGKQQKPMWWNRKIQRLRKNRLKWWNKYNEANREKYLHKYLHYQLAVNKEIRKAKRKLEKRLAANIKTDRKGFFKYSRSKMKAKQSVGPIED